MKIVTFFLCACVVIISAEPPVPRNSYGPPAPYPPAGPPKPSYGPPKPEYGPPSNGEEDAPASYQFEYAVKDEEAGLDFGHEEQREGDVATGKYFVLLPDGRKQTVEYTADSDGYHPKVTYEEEQNGNGNGYPRGPANGNGNGYPKGPANGNGGNGGYRY